MFTRSNGVWTQQGQKLLATDSVGTAQQGSSVSVSSDGNTAIVGGYEDNDYVGAVWVFTRSNGVWTQQGSKLVPSDYAGQAFVGSVAVSTSGSRSGSGNQPVPSRSRSASFAISPFLR